MEKLQAELAQVKSEGSKSGQVALQETEALRKENEELKASYQQAETARQSLQAELETLRSDMKEQQQKLTAEVSCFFFSSSTSKSGIPLSV